MKRKLIKESSSSESDVKMESIYDTFMSIDEEEKMKWKQAVKQCIQELGYEREIKFDSKAFIYLVALASAGIVLNIPFLIGMAILPSVFLGVIDGGKIKQVINCAREKRKQKSKDPINVDVEKQIGESKGQTIYLINESQYKFLIKK